MIHDFKEITYLKIFYDQFYSNDFLTIRHCCMLITFGYPPLKFAINT